MDSDSKQKLAAERTDWAAERTVLAKERTFSAWVRTAVAAMAAGLGIGRLLTSLEPDWVVRSLGAAFLLASLLCLLLGFLSYRKTSRALQESGSNGISVWIIGLFALLLGLAACVSLVLVLRH